MRRRTTVIGRAVFYKLLFATTQKLHLFPGSLGRLEERRLQGLYICLHIRLRAMRGMHDAEVLAQLRNLRVQGVQL